MLLKSTVSGKEFDISSIETPDITNAQDAMWKLAYCAIFDDFKKSLCGCRSRGRYNCVCSDAKNVILI